MKKVLMIWVGFFLITCLNAQEKTVNGKITTFNELPVINGLILVKSSNKKFYTDSLGLFSVQCLITDILTVSAEGFTKSKIRIKKETKYVAINIKLKPGKAGKELAIGYGHIKDKDKLYAMASQDENEMDFSRYRDIYEVLRSNFTGLQILGGEIIIRGASKSALLIVDGRETDQESFGNIPTSNIARVSILKDSSAAIYGVQGANGVVIVETKRGVNK